MAITIDQADPRFDMLRRSRNLRLPLDSRDMAAQVILCGTSEQAAVELQRLVKAGVRPTIRSGGHCYEDFVVNNPHGAILDLSLLSTTSQPNEGAPYRVSPGQQLGEVYTNLYKRYGVTIPGGNCYAVGAGGHISGGGYGVLSRLHGLTIDWLSGVEILTVDAHGDVALRHISKDHEPALFRACRGAGGGNFGVITGFLFDRLPKAPAEIATAHLSFDWAAMTQEKFSAILAMYSDYWSGRGHDPETWGLFVLLALSHSSAARFGLSIQFCNPDGTCDDLHVLNEFLERFHQFEPAPIAPPTIDKRLPSQGTGRRESLGTATIERHLWLDATISGSGSGGSGRAKYKSCYMKRGFSPDEARCIYTRLTAPVDSVDLRGFVLSVDSYGGAANDPAMIEATAVPQRSSIMKLQFQHYWTHRDEDEGRLNWMHDFYSDLYSIHVDPKFAGTPYPNERYDGCYINYPDVDMLAYSFWPHLYYGDQGLYPFLQKVKGKYDPNNIFHHAMSIRS